MLVINRAGFLLMALFASSLAFSQNKESKEIPTLKNPTVHIESAGHDIVINVWDQDKVKVTLESDDHQFIAQGKSLFDAFRVAFNGNPGYVRIKVDWKKFQSDSLKKMLGGQLKPLRALITVYVPARSNLNVENRFSDILLNHDFAEAEFRLVGGSLVALDIGNLKLYASLAEIKLENIARAELDLEGNPRFNARRIETLYVKSASSEINYGGGKYAYIESKMDNYHIGVIDSLICSKTSGTLTVSSVHKTLDLQGYNSDMTIRTLSPEVKNVQLANRNATVRIPLGSFKNLSLDFEGMNTIVHAPIDLAIPAQNPQADRKSRDPQFVPSKFSSSKGNAGAVKVKILCDACIVDIR